MVGAGSCSDLVLAEAVGYLALFYVWRYECYDCDVGLDTDLAVVGESLVTDGTEVSNGYYFSVAYCRLHL